MGREGDASSAVTLDDTAAKATLDSSVNLVPFTYLPLSLSLHWIRCMHTPLAPPTP